MKSFFRFLRESASQQAARMGLQGDGHGGWYDRSTGEFVAKTEKGRLKFYNKRQKVGGKDPAQTEKEKNISDPNFVDPALQQQEPAPVPKEAPKASMSSDLEAGPPPVPKTKGTLTLAFGRFNHPMQVIFNLWMLLHNQQKQREVTILLSPLELKIRKRIL